jgi:hypothetical protein
MTLVTGSTANSPYANSTATPAAAKALPATATPSASMAKAADVPSTTVTLSSQALGQAGGTPASTGQGSASTSIYDAIQSGISHAVGDVGDAIADSAHWLADGVGAVVSGADTLAHGIIALPFAVVGKICDAAGAALDAL